MATLEGKKILLAVTGSIAAYKSLFLTRLLVKQGATVKVLMTPASTKFVSTLSFSTLSKNQVFVDVTNGESWNNHVELGLWADLMLIAPCTATTLAKLAIGIADNMVVACYLSAKCPVFIAPAMDLDMWKHASSKRNIELLKSYGNTIINVGSGELASGLHGEGRMEEPEKIVAQLEDFFGRKSMLRNKRIVVTAGPTYEDLDPVRYIGNRSSGKMGLALAEAAFYYGAEVDLIIGPNNLSIPSHINSYAVRSAEEMYNVAKELHPSCDAIFFAAAVADYKPAKRSDQKIKKKQGEMQIELERTRDIAGSLAELKKQHQLHIGFALETENEEESAKAKLIKKSFDFIVLNSLRDKGAGFAHDTNKAKLYDENGLVQDFALMSKKKLAEHIIETLISRL